MKRFQKSPRMLWVGYAAVLICAFCWALLDTFVIPHRETILADLKETAGRVIATLTPDATAAPDAVAETDDAPFVQAVITDTSYEDDHIAITLSTLRQSDTTCYVADVRLSSADYLKTALAENTFGRNIRQTVSAQADENGALLAINGDYYGSRKSGWVLRNGELYRASTASSFTELLLIDQGGDFSTVSDREMTRNMADGLRQVLSFGPVLVADGAVCVDENAEVAQSMTSNPRTAIGQIGPLHYVFVVTDGRTQESDGLSLYQLSQLMHGLGCQTAYNLDGGGSSTMVFMGRVINNPTTNGRTITQREVSDIVYIGL